MVNRHGPVGITEFRALPREAYGGQLGAIADISEIQPVLRRADLQE